MPYYGMKARHAVGGSNFCVKHKNEVPIMGSHLKVLCYFHLSRGFITCGH